MSIKPYDHLSLMEKVQVSIEEIQYAISDCVDRWAERTAKMLGGNYEFNMVEFLDEYEEWDKPAYLNIVEREINRINGRV